MNLTVISAALAATFTLSGLSANAGCIDPRTSTQRGDHHPMAPLFFPHAAPGSFSDKEGAGDKIVGTWHVTYTAAGSPFGEAFIQWHNDGTEWENINFPVLGGNLCVGSWRQIDRTHVSRNHIGWLYTNGILSGYFTETETNEVARDGNSYRGTNESKVYDLDGNMIADVPGTSTAVRIPAP